MLWFISLSTNEEFLHFTIEIELINLKGNSVELKCSKWWCIQMAIFTGIIERPKMRKLVWQLIKYSRRWFHGRVAVYRLFAFHWPTLTCRREKNVWITAKRFSKFEMASYVNLHINSFNLFKRNLWNVLDIFSFFLGDRPCSRVTTRATFRLLWRSDGIFISWWQVMDVGSES